MKKKLNKLESGSEGSLRNIGVSSVSQPISRGQWERRLQTDIHMAKKALSEALSPNKALLLPNESKSNLSNDNNNSTTKPTTQSICYASSAENIARLLKGWMKNGPKLASSAAASVVTQNSFIINNLDTASSEGTTTKGSPSNSNVELSDTFEALFGYESLDYSSNSEFSQSLSPATTFFQDESKPDASDGIDMPFSLLEQWLLDDAGCQDKLNF